MTANAINEIHVLFRLIFVFSRNYTIQFPMFVLSDLFSLTYSLLSTILPSCHIFLCIYIIYLELRLGIYRFCSGNGAGPLLRERWGNRWELVRSAYSSSSYQDERNVKEPELAASYPAIAGSC